MKLLIDKEEFCSVFEADATSAKKIFTLKTLSFEADMGGHFLASCFKKASQCEDKRLIIDYYTRYILNDKFLYKPSNYFDRNLKRELQATLDLVAEFGRTGVKCQWINPAGFMLRKLTSRNHKKILSIDSKIAYIGGLNFSEHNFSWHDLMVRFDEGEIVSFLEDDFLKTWQGFHQGLVTEIDGVLFSLSNGVDSQKYCEPIIKIISDAKREIVVESPYLASPYYESLEKAASQGAKVKIIAPQANNWGLYDLYTKWKCQKHGLSLFYYPSRMNHTKAILVDGKKVIMGSSNFDFFSVHLHQELMAVLKNSEIVDDFSKRLFSKDLSICVKASGEIEKNEGTKIEVRMHNLFRLGYFANKGRFYS